MTPEIVLLREIEHGIRVLAWQRTEDAARKGGWQHFPERYPLTEAERAEHLATHEADPERQPPSLDDAKRFLGWDDPAPTPATAPAQTTTSTVTTEEG